MSSRLAFLKCLIIVVAVSSIAFAYEPDKYHASLGIKKSPTFSGCTITFTLTNLESKPSNVYRPNIKFGIYNGKNTITEGSIRIDYISAGGNQAKEYYVSAPRTKVDWIGVYGAHDGRAFGGDSIMGQGFELIGPGKTYQLD